MERQRVDHSERSKTSQAISPVRAVISWIVETDREFRAAQAMINDTEIRR